MEVLDPGHKYKLATLDGECEVILQFVKRFRGEHNHPGTTIQEVLRVLIHRTEVLHKEKPWELNKDIIQHLRMALVLYEARALVRKVEKLELIPEVLPIAIHDGHFILEK
jgi:hypothetical protein